MEAERHGSESSDSCCGYEVLLEGAKETVWIPPSYLISLATTTPPVREVTLTTAASLISGDRAKDYGDAAESFTRLAALWTPILGVDVTPEQVALCLTQLKISRLVGTPGHTDSWVDAAGYIALGSEIAARGRDEG